LEDELGVGDGDLARVVWSMSFDKPGMSQGLLQELYCCKS
jgi:hypothetical protein